MIWSEAQNVMIWCEAVFIISFYDTFDITFINKAASNL